MGWRDHIARWGATPLPGPPWARAAFLVLWALAAVLRFWNLPAQDFTHDELSALVRLYPTLEETVRTGVMQLDTHPPGVQVFEWCWTRLFGTSEAAVKFPFILLALLALPLLYRFALAWTGPAPAVLLTALLSVTQYFVLYAQLARPYAIGLFTTALLADQLTRYVAFNRRAHLIWAALAVVLSAYTHHFALLLAGLLVLGFLPLLAPTQRRAYLMACAAAALVYLPNLPIFFTQLGQGGLGEWLAPPSLDWPLQHLWWVVHGSVAFALFVASLVVLSVVRGAWSGAAPGTARWPLLLLLAWGLAPLLIGMGYSLLRAPVLQHSVLLFSFPYLALFALSGLHRWNATPTLVGASLLAFLGVRTLVEDRAHYRVMEHGRYAELVEQALAFRATATAPVAVLFDAPEHMLRFYQDRTGDTLSAVFLRDRLGDDALDALLSDLDAGTVFFGWTNGAEPERLMRIQRHFPYLLQRVDLNEGQWCILGKDRPPVMLQDRLMLTGADPLSHDAEGWEIADLPVRTMGTDSVPHWDLRDRDFGLLYEVGIDQLPTHRYTWIEAEVDVEVQEPMGNAALVAQVMEDDSTVFYRTGELGAMGQLVGPATLCVALRRADLPRNGSGMRVKLYLYDRERGPLAVRGMRVSLREHNPAQYALVEPLERPWRFAP
ncbi:MAG: glycosyltransferase family 39 protein [Flavobacteriales bacterium]